MLDHVTIRVKDLKVTKEFYLKTLEPLRYTLLHDDEKYIGFGKGKKADTWFTVDEPKSGPVHISWTADSKEEVDAFYKAAIEVGGQDNGKPGYRPQYNETYYGAFVLDPDGNNIEVVFGND